MKCCHFFISFFCFATLLGGCKKNAEPAPIPRLIGYYDTLNNYVCRYDNNNRISEIYYSDSIGRFNQSSRLRNSYTYQTNYVKAIFPTGGSKSYVEYFLNDSALPVKIMVHATINSRDSVIKQRVFYYHPNSLTVLDSIYFFNSNKATSKLITKYVDGDLSEAVIYSQGVITNRNIFSYKLLPNLIRSQNRLLYIYNDPNITEENFYLPYLFSSRKFTAYLITIPNISNLPGDAICLTNNMGQITLEQYGGVAPYLRFYLYE